jgi:hypothetical protein
LCSTYAQTVALLFTLVRMCTAGETDAVMNDIRREPKNKEITGTHDPLLVLHKEYFDCPERDSHAVHYI